MAERPTIMLAQVVLVTASCTVGVVDAFSSRTVTLFSGASASAPVFVRVRLATSSGAGGSETDIAEALRYLQTALNAAPASTLWTVALSATGYVVITYVGTGTGQLTWNGSPNGMARLLGFDSGTGTLNQNASATATYQPTHVAYGFATRGADTGWTLRAPSVTGADLPDGTALVLSDNQHVEERTFDLGLHPRDASYRASDCPITPVFPVQTRVQQPTAAWTTAPPWSLHELLRTAYTDGSGAACGRLGLAMGNFQDARSTAQPFDEVYLTAATHQAERPVKPSRPNWAARADWTGITVSRIRQLTTPS